MLVEDAWSGHVEPDYFQFYLRRQFATWASEDVPEGGYRDRLWTNGAFVYVGTLRKFGTTPIDVDVVSVPPLGPSPDWQHVAEVSLVAGGPLEILSWGGQTVATIRAPEEPLRLRVLWNGLIAGRFEGMDDDGESEEQIALCMWPSSISEPTVVRRWEGWPW